MRGGEVDRIVTGPTRCLGHGKRLFTGIGHTPEVDRGLPVAKVALGPIEELQGHSLGRGRRVQQCPVRVPPECQGRDTGPVLGLVEGSARMATGALARVGTWLHGVHVVGTVQVEASDRVTGQGTQVKDSMTGWISPLAGGGGVR